jgi:hypothetical protein
MCLPSFAGTDAADHLGAVGDRLLGMKRALRAREALADHFGVLVDENGHGSNRLRNNSNDGNAGPHIVDTHMSE